MDHINAFITSCNEDARPFIWTNSAVHQKRLSLSISRFWVLSTQSDATGYSARSLTRLAILAGRVPHSSVGAIAVPTMHAAHLPCRRVCRRFVTCAQSATRDRTTMMPGGWPRPITRDGGSSSSAPTAGTRSVAGRRERSTITPSCTSLIRMPRPMPRGRASNCPQKLNGSSRHAAASTASNSPGVPATREAHRTTRDGLNAAAREAGIVQMAIRVRPLRFPPATKH
jgi:hypothetical protein